MAGDHQQGPVGIYAGTARVPQLRSQERTGEKECSAYLPSSRPGNVRQMRERSCRGRAGNTAAAASRGTTR